MRQRIFEVVNRAGIFNAQRAGQSKQFPGDKKSTYHQQSKPNSTHQLPESLFVGKPL